MTGRDGHFGLAGAAKSKLLERLTNRRSHAADGAAAQVSRTPLGDAKVRDEISYVRRAGVALGIESPFFRVHDGIAGATSVIDGREMLNFVSYNYLGLNGDPRINAAVDKAMQRYGTSVSASRITAGERPIHHELEQALAGVYGAEEALVLVSGHATNVTVIGHLVGAGDAVVYDTLSHNSIVQGALLSGAQRVPFAHNDVDGLERALAGVAARARRILVVIEGHYSMDGDIPDLAAMLPIIRRHRAWLMVDEAHSLGVLGASGRGIAEEAGIDPREVDIWMGTLSKTLVSCGGYIAGSHDIVEYLRISVPGFLYSVGMPGPNAAAALTALELMLAEPERVARVRAAGRAFLEACKAHGLDTGTAIGSAVVPVILGSSIKVARCADILFRKGINTLPVMAPAVPERGARIRFFITALHTPEMMRETAAAVASAVAETNAMKLDLLDLAAKVRG